MSRVRNTLDTVSKAVSGTHTELLSRIAKLKPNALKGGKNAEANIESAAEVDERVVAATPATTDAASPPTSTSPKVISDSSSPSPPVPTSAAALNASPTTSTPPHSTSPATVTATVLPVAEVKEKRLRRVVPAVKAGCARKPEEFKPPPNDAESKSTTPKQPTPLFHPSTFSVNLDETYNYLSHHINSYFGSSSKTQDKKVDNVDSSSSSSSTQGQQTSDLVPVSDKPDSVAPVTPTPSKKGLGRYLSYSAPTVQAFVGSYIAPLVPRFRTAESKVVVEEKSEDAAIKQAEVAVSKEQKAAEEKARRLLLQREKVCLQM